MSTEDRYNGWANRETWAVALHINNDQGWQESVHEALREYRSGDPDVSPESNAGEAGEIVRDNVEDALDLLCKATGEGNYGDYYSSPFGLVREDIGSLWRVDWTELGAAFLEDLED